MQPEKILTLNEQLADASPVAILKTACQTYSSVGLAFSGAEDVALIDMACKIGQQPQVFCLDTGRLHPATYEFIEQVRTFYDIEIELLSPDAAALEEMVRRKGLFSFYKEGHQECCGIRKIEPLKRKLATLDAWITGQRRSQSPTRSNLMPIEADSLFSTQSHPVVKFNPLTCWSLEDVWDYIRDNKVPTNSLHDQGYVSIGCAPCTRPPGPGEHERAGRWWWEAATLKECGLHADRNKIPAIKQA